MIGKLHPGWARCAFAIAWVRNAAACDAARMPCSVTSRASRAGRRPRPSACASASRRRRSERRSSRWRRRRIRGAGAGFAARSRSSLRDRSSCRGSYARPAGSDAGVPRRGRTPHLRGSPREHTHWSLLMRFPSDESEGGDDRIPTLVVSPSTVPATRSGETFTHARRACAPPSTSDEAHAGRRTHAASANGVVDKRSFGAVPTPDAHEALPRGTHARRSDDGVPLQALDGGDDRPLSGRLEGAAEDLGPARRRARASSCRRSATPKSTRPRAGEWVEVKNTGVVTAVAVRARADRGPPSRAERRSRSCS